jgi:hypothetical protein
MKHSVLLFSLAALFGATASADITYSVEVSWTGVGGLSTSTATTSLTATTDADTLTLNFVPDEPTGTVGNPTNTAWGSLFLEDTDPPTTGSDTFTFSDATLTLELIDVTTGEHVIYTGTLSGTYTADPGNTGNSSSGSIAWSPTGLQNLAPPSTVSFLTDPSDSIGVTLDSGGFTKASTTVNGTVENNPASVLPEPATLAMMGFGLISFGLVSRRRRAQR